MLTKYKSKIAAEDPINKNHVKYNKDRWRKHFSNKKNLNCLDSYDKKKIGRKEIIKEFKFFFKAKKESGLTAFLMTMVWGYDNAGYGPHRVNAFLSPDNIKLIENGLNAIRNGEEKTAFDILKSMPGLGISFISKIMYFAGRARGIKTYPLIFDIRVAQSLVSLSSDSQLDGIVDARPVNTFDAYKAYNYLLHKWADELKVDADKVEFFLFKWRNSSKDDLVTERS